MNLLTDRKMACFAPARKSGNPRPYRLLLWPRKRSLYFSFRCSRFPAATIKGEDALTHERFQKEVFCPALFFPWAVPYRCVLPVG